jgi:NADH-quinone oxidoreductase subunit B
MAKKNKHDQKNYLRNSQIKNNVVKSTEQPVKSAKIVKDKSKSIIAAPSGMFSDKINEPFEHEMMRSTGGEILTKEEKQNKWSKMANYFRANSLWMLMYCTGCCAIELPQAMTSRYDMERLGMGPMATPRQADILLITGYLSLKTLRRLIYTYEQMSEPKYVVGFGPCTLNGGIYHDSHAVINQLDQYVPIDLYIAGCMPKPEAVMNGFGDLIALIESGKATGWKDYHARYEWYKQNQKEALGEVMVHDEFHE